MPSPSVALLCTQSDERLATLAAAGHERAFEAIVERYRRQLLRHARRHLHEARAEDALQQALVSAWTGLRRGDDVQQLRPWLHRIVHNAALNALRAPGYDYEELRATLEGSGGPAELAERRALVRATLAGLAALPERQREALLRIAVEGRSQDEVAEQLGLSQGAVRQLVHRARTALRTAATAVMPLPLATWLANAGAGRGDIAIRVGELVAGAGGSATLAKAGAVAAIAGGAVAGPAVVHDVSERSPQEPRAEAAATEPAAPARREADAARSVQVAEGLPELVVAPSGTAQGPRGRDDDRGEWPSGRSGERDEGGQPGSGGAGPGGDDFEPGGDDEARHGGRRDGGADRGPGGHDDHRRPGGSDDDSGSDDERRSGSRGDDEPDDDRESDPSGGDDESGSGGDDDGSGDDDSGPGGDDSGPGGDDDDPGEDTVSGDGDDDGSGGDDDGSGDGDDGPGEDTDYDGTGDDSGSGADDGSALNGGDEPGSGAGDDQSRSDGGSADPPVAPSPTPQPDDDDSG